MRFERKYYYAGVFIRYYFQNYGSLLLWCIIIIILLSIVNICPVETRRNIKHKPKKNHENKIRGWGSFYTFSFFDRPQVITNYLYPRNITPSSCQCPLNLEEINISACKISSV